MNVAYFIMMLLRARDNNIQSFAFIWFDKYTSTEVQKMMVVQKMIKSKNSQTNFIKNSWYSTMIAIVEASIGQSEFC